MKPNQWHTEIDWRLQNALTLSAPVIKWRLKNRLALEQSLTSAQTARLRALAKNYNLAGWEGVCTHREYMLNLHVLDVCDRYGPPGAESDVRWILAPRTGRTCRHCAAGAEQRGTESN